jgi:hypothetical protein
MDGNHIFAFDSRRISSLKFVLDSAAYSDEEQTDIGVLDADVFVEK